MDMYEDIRRAVRRMSLRDYTPFNCGGLDHCLVYNNHGEETTPAYYSYPSHQVSGADIILWKTIPKRFRRPIIFHEVAEFLLRNPSYETGIFEFDMEEAHLIAKEWDERFAEEAMDKEAFNEFISYKSMFSG
ncbi:MAG: hypothetical protein QMD85_01030 [Candidatus Aenigmarchaeota archaeon]|nr:hypothetical protein [Candidatus Aenigmarchaeota archaeon]MDI6722123.1 hypothetical protein [Candidatus Aenigmarchaeota archaeon]